MAHQLTYSDLRRLNRPATPMPMAQIPRTSITPGDGSGTGSSHAAVDACEHPAARIIIDNNDFMPSSLGEESWITNKPGAQIPPQGTSTGRVSNGRCSPWSRYLNALVLVMFVGAGALAADTRTIELVLPAHFDPFAVDAQNQYGAAARLACAAPKPAGFIGYYWRLPAVAAELRKMTGESTGKQIYIAFLKSKYGYQISKLNRDYGTDAQSFTELLESPMKNGVEAHDAEFDRAARSDMFDAILAALRKCDAEHADGVLRLMADLFD